MPEAKPTATLKGTYEVQVFVEEFSEKHNELLQYLKRESTFVRNEKSNRNGDDEYILWVPPDENLWDEEYPNMPHEVKEAMRAAMHASIMKYQEIYYLLIVLVVE